MRNNSGLLQGALLVVLAFLASAAGARSNDLQIFPRSGDPRGGTEVHIRLTSAHRQFAAPQVFFGTVPSPSVTLFGASEIKAVTPPHPIGIVPVTVVDNGVVLESLSDFVFEPKLEEIVIPLVLHAAEASYGTRWSTEITVYNAADHAVSLDPQVCYSIGTPFLCATAPRWLAPRSSMTLEPRRSQSPGPMVILPPAEDADQLHFSVRLRELTRNASGPGVEVPVVRERDFQRNRIALPAVPTNDAYRSTLRVLTRATHVTVRVSDETTGEVLALEVRQRHLPTDIDPLVTAVFNELLASAAIRSRARVRVEVQGNRPVWAMLSLTNNETQRVELFTPQ